LEKKCCTCACQRGRKLRNIDRDLTVDYHARVGQKHIYINGQKFILKHIHKHIFNVYVSTCTSTYTSIYTSIYSSVYAST